MATKTHNRITKLRDLEVDSISLVAEGADQLAPVVIAKSRGAVSKDMGDMAVSPEPPKPKTFAEIYGACEAMEKWEDAREAVENSFYSILRYAAPADRVPLLKQTVDEFQQAVDAFIDELPDAVQKSASTIAAVTVLSEADVMTLRSALSSLPARADALAKDNKDTKTMTFDPATLTPEAKAEFDAITKRAADAEAQLEAVKKTAAPAAAPKPEDVSKALAELPEPIRKALEAQTAAADAAKAEAEEIKKEMAKQAQTIEAMSKAAARKELLAKAKDIGAVPGLKTEEVAELLEKSATPELTEKSLRASAKVLADFRAEIAKLEK
jgi:hypothetical protein